MTPSSPELGKKVKGKRDSTPFKEAIEDSVQKPPETLAEALLYARE